MMDKMFFKIMRDGKSFCYDSKNVCGANANESRSSFPLPIRSIFSYDEASFCTSQVERPCDLKDAETWRTLLNEGIITHDYYPFIKGYLLSELCQSDIDVPTDILRLVVSDGRAKGRYKSLDKYLALCNNENSLRYLLRHGAKFKRIRGYGDSTMENYIENAKFINVLQEFPAQADKRYIRKHKFHTMAAIFRLIKDNRDDEAYFLAFLICNGKGGKQK